MMDGVFTRLFFLLNVFPRPRGGRSLFLFFSPFPLLSDVATRGVFDQYPFSFFMPFFFFY